MKKTILLSLALIALTNTLQAENQFTLEQIEVTAAQGTTLNKKDVTDSVTVITKEALEEAKVTTLSEALNQLGNMAMTQNGGAGTSSSMFIRGMDSKRTLVLIDGVRYNNPTAIGSAAEFSQIMLYNVEQIEIIKGAQSGVWGADASGGVINIITSKAKKGLHAVANIEYGSFDTVTTSLQSSYATDDYDITIGGLIYNTDGFSAAEPKQSEANYGKRYDELGLEKDSYNNKSFNSKLGYNITSDDRVELSLQTINSLVNSDAGAGETKDSNIPNTSLQNRFYTASYTHKDSLNNIKLQYSLSTFDREYIGATGSSSKYIGSVNELKVDDKISYLENSFLRVGTSYQKFEQENITADTDKSYSATSAFLTNYNKFKLIASNDTILTESIRYDEYDNVDNSLTGKVGLKQFLHEDFYLSVNIGTGFNAPTLGQLYGSSYSNPDLKPEKSVTSDFTIGNDTIWLTGFYNEIMDLIEFDLSAWSYVQASGISKFKGIEVGYEDFFFEYIGLKAMYTYLETQNANEQSLARRPKDQIDASIKYYVSDTFDLGLNAQYIGERYDSIDNQGAQTGKYTIANFITNIKVNDYITFYGKINNLTDKYYQTVDGYATAGRSLYIGLNAKY